MLAAMFFYFAGAGGSDGTSPDPGYGPMSFTVTLDPPADDDWAFVEVTAL